MFKKIAIASFFTMILVACGSSSTNEEQVEVDENLTLSEEKAELYEEVIAIHDEAMFLMGDLMRLKGKLQEKMDSTSMDSASASHYTKTIENLDAAYDGMMQWMRNFERQEDTVAHEVAMEYYEEQRQAIVEVQQKMEEAKSSAEALQN